MASEDGFGGKTDPFAVDIDVRLKSLTDLARSLSSIIIIKVKYF